MVMAMTMRMGLSTYKSVSITVALILTTTKYDGA